MQVLQVGQEIVSYKEREENKVVNDPFKVVSKVEGRLDVVEFELEVFPENREM